MHMNSDYKIDCNSLERETVESVESGHLWCKKNLSASDKCPLYRQGGHRQMSAL